MAEPWWELYALPLDNNMWAVRPVGALGTHGWIDGKAWAVVYIRANTEKQAIARVKLRAAMVGSYPCADCKRSTA
jgi:hypothetical protein